MTGRSKDGLGKKYGRKEGGADKSVQEYETTKNETKGKQSRNN